MIILITTGLIITIAPFFIQLNYLTVQADLKQIELKYLEGNIFLLENRRALYGLKNNQLYYYSQQRRSWELHPWNFNPFLLHANKYDIKVIDQATLPSRYKKDFLFNSVDIS